MTAKRLISNGMQTKNTLDTMIDGDAEKYTKIQKFQRQKTKLICFNVI